MNILTVSNVQVKDYEGSGYVIITIAQKMRERGHVVDIIEPSEYELFPRMKGRLVFYRLSLGLMIYTLKNIRKIRKYDVFEVYGGSGFLSLAIIKLVAHDVFVVSRSNGLEPHLDSAIFAEQEKHGIDIEKGKLIRKFNNFFCNIAYKCCDLLVTVSEFDRQYGVRNKLKEEDKIVAINNGISEEYFMVKNADHSEDIIAFCGSWIPRKGVLWLPEVFTRILRDRENVKLYLIGVGADFQVSKYFIEEHIERVNVFHTIRNRNEMVRIVGKVKIVVMPSIYESFGLSFIESMACGCAVVGTNTGILSEARDGYDALIMNELSVDYIYASVCRLLDDRELCRTIANNGKIWSNKFKWTYSINNIESLYKKNLQHNCD